MKVKFPELFAVTVPLDVPLRVKSVPLPDGLTVPEIDQVGIDVAVKAMLAGLAPFTDTAWFVGLNVKPVLLGVTV